MKPLKVYLADDHLLIREGLKKILSSEKNFTIVGESGDPDEVLDFINDNEVDILILDLNMPGRSGLDILKHVKNIKPEVKVLILSMYSEDQFGERTIKAGASGYITKESASEELLNALHKIAKGGNYVSPAFAEKLLFRKQNIPDKKPHEILSDREFQIMILLAKGKTQVEISNELALSSSTVNTYRSRILEKLNLKSNAEIIRYAIQNNLI
ncbi:response regulator transcription factor [Ignavibacterium sp.]|uniref:response regulator n=1 Tax=Ignavibacterium sp. TaxID=2651167 RepID=UPI00220ED495|nr:response regulator transcription factor [Ignavibacterium sp.]BDQ02915.1 MAG: DNA-binding response regulator [Ignavibacterium sp.]